jgi:hypothetical protein
MSSDTINKFLLNLKEGFYWGFILIAIAPFLFLLWIAAKITHK